MRAYVDAASPRLVVAHATNQDPHVHADFDSGQLHAQVGDQRTRAGSSGSRGSLQQLQWVSMQHLAHGRVRPIDVFMAAQRPRFSHRERT